MALRYAALAVPLLALTGCASLGAEDAEVAARQFVAAAAEACALVAPRAAADCAEAIPAVGDLGEVRAVELWGDEARAETGDSVLFLHEFTAGWLITGAGCEGDGESPYECEVGGP